MNLFIDSDCVPYGLNWDNLFSCFHIPVFHVSMYSWQYIQTSVLQQQGITTGIKLFSHINFVIKYKRITVTGIWNQKNWTASTWDTLQSTYTWAMDLVQCRPELRQQCRMETDAIDASAQMRVCISADKHLRQPGHIRKEEIFLCYSMWQLCGAKNKNKTYSRVWRSLIIAHSKELFMMDLWLIKINLVMYMVWIVQSLGILLLCIVWCQKKSIPPTEDSLTCTPTHQDFPFQWVFDDPPSTQEFPEFLNKDFAYHPLQIQSGFGT